MVKPLDYRDRGRQHYLIGKHNPERVTTSYVTRDKCTEDPEALFVAGWHEERLSDEAKADDMAARESPVTW